MKLVSNRRFDEAMVALVIFLATFATIVPVSGIAVPINDPVGYPLPTNPEPVLLGSALRVEVRAGSGATSWSGSLTGKYGSSDLTPVNSSYSGGWWTVFFGVPFDVYPALYDLELDWSDGGSSVEYTQPVSVWVLEEWPETLKIIQISDVHLPHGADNFATFIHEVNLLDPDMIVVTGDIVETETVASSWPYLQEITKRTDTPIYLLPGNHDYSGAHGRIYAQYGGMFNYSIMLGDFVFLALNTHGGGYIFPEELEWADNFLARYPDKVKIVGFHHPIFGRVRGGNITGSWETMEELESLIYFTWLNFTDYAQETLRIIEKHDVRLVMSGHIHRDLIYLLNGEHYFVSTCASGGALYPDLYHSFRIFEVDSEGNVLLDEYARSRLLDPPNSIPIGSINYFYAGANDGSEEAASARVVNGLSMELQDVKLEFLVNSENPLESYEFYSDAPIGYDVMETDVGYLFIATVDIPAGGVYDLTVAAVEDTALPSVEIGFLDEHVADGFINVTIDSVDSGWGLREVSASYSLNGGETWVDADVPISGIVDKQSYEINLLEASFIFPVEALPDFGTLIIRAEAIDFAENSGLSEASLSFGAPPLSVFSLSVDSSPVSGVTVIVDGVGYESPFAADLEEGSHTVVVSEEVTEDGVDYAFTGWADGSTDAERSVSLSGDMDLEALYEEVVAEEPDPEPDPEPDAESEPDSQGGGIPIPYTSVAVGLLLSVVVLFLFRRR